MAVWGRIPSLPGDARLLITPSLGLLPSEVVGFLAVGSGHLEM